MTARTAMPSRGCAMARPECARRRPSAFAVWSQVSGLRSQVSGLSFVRSTVPLVLRNTALPVSGFTSQVCSRRRLSEARRGYLPQSRFPSSLFPLLSSTLHAEYEIYETNPISKWHIHRQAKPFHVPAESAMAKRTQIRPDIVPNSTLRPVLRKPGEGGPVLRRLGAGGTQGIQPNPT